MRKKPAGRKPKMPSRRLRHNVLVLELQKYLSQKKHFRPWAGEASFLFRCVMFPFIKQVPLPRPGEKIVADNRVLDALKFANLWSQNPVVFSKMYLAIENLLLSRMNSPEVMMAFMLDKMDKDKRSQSAEKLVDGFQKMKDELPAINIFTSKKVVEHARKRLRSY